MKHTPSRAALAILACLALLLTGGATMTPAGATMQDQVAGAAKQNWNKVWKQQIRPRADKRYFTKNQANKRFATTTQADAKYAAKGDVYTKAESDGKYAGKADVYTKAESDGKFALQRTVFRGNYLAGGPSTGAASFVFGDLSFGATLSAPPTAHYIKQGDPLPAGCLGTAAAPDAQPGHLCVFEANALGVSANRQVTNASFAPNTATPVGAWLYASTTGVGHSYFGGSWVLRTGPGVSVLATAKVPTMGTAQGSPR